MDINRQFKHQTLFATQTQAQRNQIVNTNPMCRICHTPISQLAEKYSGLMSMSSSLSWLLRQSNFPPPSTPMQILARKGRGRFSLPVDQLQEYPPGHNLPPTRISEGGVLLDLWPNSHRTCTHNASQCDLLCQWECSHWSQATSMEKRSNLRARRVARPV